MPVRTFFALLQREGDGYVAICPEFDVALTSVQTRSDQVNLERTCASLPGDGADELGPHEREDVLLWLTP